MTCCAGFDKVFVNKTVGADVYIGGEFSSVGGARGTRGITRYNRRRWHDLGGDLIRYFTGTRTNVLALASDGERLIVGGSFLDLAERATGRRLLINQLFIYTPRDDSVAILGSGESNGVRNSNTASVRAITIANDGIHIGGQFKNVNGVTAVNIARLDANGWSALGTGAFGADDFRDGVSAITANGTDIYIGGSFETAGVEAFNIARWNRQTASWSALGCGIARNSDAVRINHVAAIAI